MKSSPGLSRARIYTRYLIAPDPPVAAFIGQRERQTWVFGKDESAYVLLDENRGFNVTFRGAKPIPDEDYARYRERPAAQRAVYLRCA